MEELHVLITSLRLAEKTKNKKLEGEVQNDVGIHYYTVGQYDKAVEHFEVYLTIAKESGDKHGEESAYCSLGSCYHSLGQYDKAIKYLEMWLTIAKEIGSKNGEEAAYCKLGSCYHSLGQYDKAIVYHEMSLTITKEIGNKNGEEAALYGNVGNCRHSLGQYDKAIKYLEMRLNIAKETGNKHDKGKAYGNLGACYNSLGQYDKAIKYQEMYLTIAKETGDKKEEGLACHNLGVCYSSLRKHDEAESNLMKAVECYEKLFENVPKWDEHKVTYTELFITSYKLLIQVLLAQEKRDKALIVAEKGRSRALADLMFTTNLFPFDTGTKISDLHEIRKVIKALRSTVIYFTLLDTSDICTWIIQPNGDVLFRKCCIKMLVQSRKYDGQENEFFHSVEDLNSLVNKAIELMKPYDADRGVDPEEASKTTKKKPESVRACVALPVNLTVPESAESQHRIPDPTPMQDQKIASTRDSEDQDEEPDESMMNPLKFLYQILLEPVQQFVVGSQAIVVPEGRLALLPFAALMDETGHYVAESLQVRLIPSLATAKMNLERSENPSSQARPLIIGDPQVGKVKRGNEKLYVSRLPCANDEVEMVGKFLKGTPLVGMDATKENFLGRVESANLIHIAAHADAKRGEILLARPSAGSKRIKMENIMLTISDLECKRINAKLVVLSCSHSGCGDVVEAEGVVGIARAFLGAGARAVVATLWALHDQATLGFMWHFYESLRLGESANAALNKAMIAIITQEIFERFRHPRYWAPFILLGENVTVFRKKMIDSNEEEDDDDDEGDSS